MKIYVVLRNLYNNPDPFDDEMLVGDSDVNIISEACQLRDSLIDEGKPASVTALLFSESESDSTQVLKKAASYGADFVYHAAVDGFNFTDANIFSKLIASVVTECFSTENALLMFGRLAYDGDSVNIATQVAAHLGWNRAIYSKTITALNPDDSTLEFIKSLDGGRSLRASLKLPAVVHSIRKENLRRQAKVQDILRAYGDFEVEAIGSDVVNRAMAKAMSGPSLGAGIQEIPPYSEAKEMINLNGISDVETARNIINVLKSLGFEPAR